MTLVVGADAVPRGWVSVSLDEERLVSMERHARLADLVNVAGNAAFIAVDVPLVEVHEEELPPLLTDRVREARERAAEDERLVAASPEAAFNIMADNAEGDERLNDRPRSWPGVVQRLRLLHDEGLRPTRSFGGVGRAYPTDVLAATACAWTARRVARGEALELAARLYA